VDDAVNRKVSLSLRDVEPAAAVQSIATANGLALSRIGGITMMGEGIPTDLATYRLSGTESYRMQNTQAQTASVFCPTSCTSTPSPTSNRTPSWSPRPRRCSPRSGRT
jgi:hypothetical protein